HGERRVIDIGVARDKDHVHRVPAPFHHLGARCRQRGQHAIDERQLRQLRRRLVGRGGPSGAGGWGHRFEGRHGAVAIGLSAMDVQSSIPYYGRITLRWTREVTRMATTAQVEYTPEDLLRITDRPMPELIDGQLVERPLMGRKADAVAAN